MTNEKTIYIKTCSNLIDDFDNNIINYRLSILDESVDKSEETSEIISRTCFKHIQGRIKRHSEQEIKHNDPIRAYWIFKARLRMSVIDDNVGNCWLQLIEGHRYIERCKEIYITSFVKNIFYAFYIEVYFFTYLLLKAREENSSTQKVLPVGIKKEALSREMFENHSELISKFEWILDTKNKIEETQVKYYASNINSLLEMMELYYCLGDYKQHRNNVLGTQVRISKDTDKTLILAENRFNTPKEKRFSFGDEKINEYVQSSINKKISLIQKIAAQAEKGEIFRENWRDLVLAITSISIEEMKKNRLSYIRSNPEENTFTRTSVLARIALVSNIVQITGINKKSIMRSLPRESLVYFHYAQEYLLKHSCVKDLYPFYGFDIKHGTTTCGSPLYGIDRIAHICANKIKDNTVHPLIIYFNRDKVIGLTALLGSHVSILLDRTEGKEIDIDTNTSSFREIFTGYKQSYKQISIICDSEDEESILCEPKIMEAGI
jgi:hypothetical protein